jgi:hypothetical protein
MLSQVSLDERRPEQTQATPTRVGERVLANYRGIDGIVSSTSIGVLNGPLLCQLSREYNSINQDSDIVSIYLRSQYTTDAMSIIQGLLDDNLPFTVTLDRLVAAGIPIREAFFILSLQAFADGGGRSTPL